jgi:ribosomal protein S27AE
VVTTPQRAYRAACPNCGAPVDFASAASASAVCGFCRSTLVRDGDALRRIGVSAELFDDHSPLQLGASGTRQGVAFTLVGRLQYGYSEGTWNEWHALFDNGRSAWLSEDNGAYVIAFDAPLPADGPQDAEALAALRAGQRTLADGRAWDVASTVRAKLIAAQGELPTPPRLQGEFTVVDLRNSAGEVATLDASDPAQLHWSVGRSVALSELRMAGLKDGAAEKTLASRSIECPSCGASLQPTLASTKSLTCGQCKSVVDISQGVGGELSHYAQNNAGAAGAEPQIALGSIGTLALGGAAVPWQVVGYQERCDIPDSSEEETSFWREYLLYNQTEGFAFLVDSNDGWSWVKPITGAPAVRGAQADWAGVRYTQKWRYAATVTWVQGEFYWRVKRDERALVADYEGTGADSGRRLSREQSGNEVTWSAGQTLDAAVVAEAFAVAPGARAALQRDVAPFTATGNGSRNAIVVFVVIVLLFAMLSRCDRDDCDGVRQTFGQASTEYQQCARQRATSGVPRTGGGSFGGYSSGGGGHK